MHTRELVLLYHHDNQYAHTEKQQQKDNHYLGTQAHYITLVFLFISLSHYRQSLGYLQTAQIGIVEIHILHTYLYIACRP